MGIVEGGVMGRGRMSGFMTTSRLRKTVLKQQQEIERLQGEIEDRNVTIECLLSMDGRAEIERLQEHITACSDTCGFQARKIERLRGALERNVQERHRYKHIEMGHHCGWRVIAEAMIERSREALRDD